MISRKIRVIEKLWNVLLMEFFVATLCTLPVLSFNTPPVGRRRWRMAEAAKKRPKRGLATFYLNLWKHTMEDNDVNWGCVRIRGTTPLKFVGGRATMQFLMCAAILMSVSFRLSAIFFRSLSFAAFFYGLQTSFYLFENDFFFSGRCVMMLLYHL